MRIAYTHHAFCLGRYGGVSRYFTEVALRLAERPADCDVAILAMAHFNAHLRAPPADLVTGRYVPHVPKTWRLRRALNDWLTGRYFQRHPPPDIVHQTYYGPRLLAPSRSKTVLTVFDMTHERYPASFPPSDRTAAEKAATVRRADHIICISEHTRTELIELLRVDPAKTSVVHLGCSLHPPQSSTAPFHAFPAPCLLYVGDRGGYKNFDGLLRALAAVRRELPLVCFGGGRFRHAERQLMRRLGFGGDEVIQLGGGDDVLVSLYRQAAALVYPSRSEGFGLPVLEAMASGCPVACSGTTSLPEIAGDAAELFDPDDAAQIASAIERAVSPTRAATLRASGQERAKRFTWERCAAATYDVYRRLAEG